MHELESRFIEVAKRHATVGMLAAQALNDEQDRLQLELVLSQERLASREGTAISLGVLDSLDAFLAQHQQIFIQQASACTAELAQLLSVLPESLQAHYSNSVLAAIDWQFDAQRLLYRNRDRWIAAAREICLLVDACRDSLVFGEDGMGFANEEDLQRSQALFAIIEEVHQLEVEQMRQRTQRLTRALAVLQQGGQS